MFGWIFVFGRGEVYSFGTLAWLANPLALVSVGLLVIRRPTGAAAFGVASVVVGALFMFDSPGQHGHRDIPRVGAWLWLGSLLGLAIAGMIRRGRPQAQNHAEP
jgi:hypothetical protein